MRATEPQDLNERALRDRAVAAARGDEPFDLLIRDGSLFDAITGETRKADIGLIGPLIASVHATGLHQAASQSINASCQIAIPGLIDTHMHVESSMITPASYAQAVLPRGVTSIVWDPHELGNVHGMAGVNWAIEASSELDLRVVLLAPSCVPSAPGLELAGADFAADTLQSILAMPQVGGVAEVMNMRGVIEREERMTSLVQAGLDSGKPVFGHARSLSGPDLAAFMAAGVVTDHEITSAEDLMHKLRAGLGIELRGSHDHLLPECVAALNELGFLPSNLTLCTDDVFPDDLYERGGLDDVVRRLISYGMPASWALRAASYNAALRLSRPDLGLLAAGRRADLALVDSLDNLHCHRVITNGKTVAVEGKCLTTPIACDTTPLISSVKVDSLDAGDFHLHAKGDSVKIRAIHKPRFTEHATLEARVVDGIVIPPAEVTLMAITHRHGRAAAKPKVAFLTGWGQWQGAFATTVSHDSHNLTAFGGHERDLAAACNAVIQMQGGMAVAIDGKVIATLPLPLSGLISDRPLSEISEQFKNLRDAMDQVIQWQPPYLIFKACFGASLACNAGPHLTDMGIADHAISPTPLSSIM
ncbi:adenine deaminase [Granulosicoccus antarcticus]|uniref:Adenine deaminase n=1 Tax=Granulosicoccus antarcticus IMCC3135 TaxID=1192854 RepID=A0A2Z2NWR0_9GAMM|nr:adenine deaminase C-terminal domain-containing protein [Granulosicoccus antarcticus]ASJ74178.1 Adenine deaminase 2 [Granulosicoccus antarcticus IMCC3135]